MCCGHHLSAKQLLPPRVYRNPVNIFSVLISFLLLGLFRPRPNSCVTAHIFVLDRNKRERSGGGVGGRAEAAAPCACGTEEADGVWLDPGMGSTGRGCPVPSSRCCGIHVGTRDVQ